MRRILAPLLLSGALAFTGASAQQARDGVVYSFVQGGQRFYSAKPPPPGSTGIRVIPYSIPAAPAGLPPVYRCPRDDQGRIHYSSRPYPDCVAIGIQMTRPALQKHAAPRPSPRVPAPPHNWQGYRCADDCSGHEAGYQWAEQNGIDDPDDCGGRSQSFIEGCEAYAEEAQQQMIQDGECDDADEDERCDD